MEGLKFKIPEDIAIASFNNSIISRYSQIPFTSVDVNAHDLGLESINILVEALEKGMQNRRIIIPMRSIRGNQLKVCFLLNKVDNDFP